MARSTHLSGIRAMRGELTRHPKIFCRPPIFPSLTVGQTRRSSILRAVPTQLPPSGLVHACDMKADSLLPHVMVVDDDDDDVVLLTRHLQSAGIKNPVLHFRNGGDAFMSLKQFCP